MSVDPEEFEEFRERYENLKDKVEYVLRTYPTSRNSDELLWWLVLKIFYPDVYEEFRKGVKRGYIPYDVLKKIPKFETISRIRRKFNEKCMYLPTDEEVLNRRKRGEKKWRMLMAEE